MWIFVRRSGFNPGWFLLCYCWLNSRGLEQLLLFIVNIFVSAFAGLELKFTHVSLIYLLFQVKARQHMSGFVCSHLNNKASLKISWVCQSCNKPVILTIVIFSFSPKWRVNIFTQLCVRSFFGILILQPS